MHASILKYFAAVARSGSIRKASEELHVATSAVSRQIKKLEDELGTPLFERLSDGLRLTSAGEVVLRHAKETLQKYEVMASELSNLKGKKSGKVKITCIDSLIAQFLPDFVIAFSKRHPGIDFRVQADNHSNIFRIMTEGDADIGITFNVARPHNIKLVSSVQIPMMAMMAREHPLARQTSVTLQECAQFKLLLQLNNDLISSMISIELAALDKFGRTFIATNNQLMLKPIILSGDGIAFFTPAGLMKELEAGDIVARPIAGSQLHTTEIGIMLPRHRQISPATLAVAEALSRDLQRFNEKINQIIGK